MFWHPYALILSNLQITFFMCSSCIQLYIFTEAVQFKYLLKGTTAEPQLEIKPSTFELQAEFPNHYTSPPPTVRFVIALDCMCVICIVSVV